MLNATPFRMALLSAADLVAGLLVGFVAGVWVDRMRRRPMMIATDLGRAVLLVTIPIAAAFRILRIEQPYAVEFLAGAMTMVFVVAYQACLPTLVRREEPVRANSVLTASSAVSEVAAFGSTAMERRLQRDLNGNTDEDPRCKDVEGLHPRHRRPRTQSPPPLRALSPSRPLPDEAQSISAGIPGMTAGS